jgi:hypothetical protein
MSMMVDITPDKGFLHVLVTGNFSLEESNNTITRIYQALVQHALHKVLVDFRQTEGDPTTLERFFHAEFVAKEMYRFADDGSTRFTQFAYVGTEPMIERSRFGETVALNRGVIIKVTDNMDEAQRWLEIDPDRFGPTARFSR